MTFKKSLPLFLVPFLTQDAFGWDGWKFTAPPVGGDLLGGSKFSLSLDYTLRHSDELFRGDSEIPNGPDISTTFQRYSLTGSYRLSDDWILRATLPYTYAEREENGIPNDTLDGFGDLSFSAMWFPPSIKGLSFTAGFIAPTGNSKRQPLVGEANPEVFQLGTGAWQGTLGAGYSWSANEWSFRTKFDAIFPLQTSSNDFRPAASFFVTAEGGRSISETLRGSLGIVVSHSERDVFSGIDIANTGSTNVVLKPSLVWQINDNLAASLSALIPVYREVNRTQIAIGPSFSIGLSKNF